MPSLRLLPPLLLLGLAGGGSAAPPARRHYVDQEQFPHAMCLDGSPATFYVRRAAAGASEAGQRRWLISLQGGGNCRIGFSKIHTSFVHTFTNETIRLDNASTIVSLDCMDRRTSILGTSRHDPPEQDISYKEVFSDDPAVNPVFHDWNVVFARYCDGSSWVGFSDVVDPDCKDPDLQAGGECVVFHYRGTANLLGVVASLLQDHGMADATDVVLHGCSAGCFGAIHLGHLVQEMVPASVAFSVVADSCMEGATHFPWAQYNKTAQREAFQGAVHRAIPWLRGRVETGEADAAMLEALKEYDGSDPFTPRYLAARRALSSHIGFDPLGWEANATISTECKDFIVATLEMDNPFAAWMRCKGTTYGVAFSSVPLFILNSLDDNYAVSGAGSKDMEKCKQDQRCRDHRTLLSREWETQLEWAFDMRRTRKESVPLGAFIDRCPHHCMKWHELSDAEGATNAERVGEWLAAVRRWREAEVGGPALTEEEREATMRVTWQRKGAVFPCEDCCDRPVRS